MAAEDRAHDLAENAHVCSPKRIRWKGLEVALIPIEKVSVLRRAGCAANSMSLSAAK
jgi:hypothetical protein